MKRIIPIFFLCFLLIMPSCDQLQNIQIEDIGALEPTSSEMTAAIKQALEAGTKRAVAELNQEGGYLENPAVRIPFPPEAQKVANTLRDIGAGQLVDDFVESLNRGAERAVADAVPIFVDAVRQMTLQDVRNIILGPDDAATEYFRSKTQQALYSKFKPQVTQALHAVYATRYWESLTTRYNRIPLVEPVNTDLADYATDRALDGLFLQLKQEEEKIREDPVARTTEIMREVFSWAQQQKG